MTPEERAAIRLRAIKECPHWQMGDKLPRPCRDCELDAAIAEEREACVKLAEAAECNGPDCDRCGCKEAAVSAIRARHD